MTVTAHCHVHVTVVSDSSYVQYNVKAIILVHIQLHFQELYSISSLEYLLSLLIIYFYAYCYKILL